MNRGKKKVLFYTTIAKKLQIINGEETKQIMNSKKVQR